MKTARPWIAFLLALALLLPLLAACGPRRTPTQAVAETSTPATPSTAEPSAAPTTPPPATGAAASFEKASCPMQLPSGLVEGQTIECGYLSVPEDRTDPNSPTIRLAVAVFHPGGQAEPDPIIYLEGGPGGSSLELLYLSYSDTVEPYLAANRDIILFDQRGVGLSQPALDCPNVDQLGLDLLDWNMDGKQVTPQEAADLTVQADVTCASDLAGKANLADYNTETNAADVNDLRLALGYDEANLWGTSYGTNLGLEVMRSYPEGVRSVVLDSVVPPDVDVYVEGPANAARAFNVLFQTCAADTACNTAYPDLRQVLTDTVAKLNASPASFQVTDALSNETYDMVMTGDDFLGVLFQLFYVDSVIPSLPQVIFDARDGTYDLVRRMIGVLLAQDQVISEGMYYSVECRDEVAFSSPDKFEEAVARYPGLKSLYTNSNVGPVGYAICARWGAGKAGPAANQAVVSDIPTLLMAGQFDPVTPPSWTRHAGQTLKNSHFFEYPALTHGASLAEGCPRDMMIAFIQDPTTAPDDSCIAGMPAVKFVVPVQGQAVTMEPFTSSEMGIEGLVPAGWKQVTPGVYSRGSSSLDTAVLLEQGIPATTSELLALLVQQLSLKETPTVVGEREANGLTWQLYNVEVQGTPVDMALAQSGGTALLVLLQSDSREHDALYDSVFLPAVDALQVSK